MKKSYFLVVTDEFSRFSWVFFLATKDETSGILKTFIKEIENQLNYKVKVIRCDNGTEFKNSVMNQFCEIKGIKREFSVARTPQHNNVSERRNRTLIKAARTMLVDSKLPTTFWAEVVNTACYVLNRVLVIKPYNKTPYELIRGRTSLIDFIKPFGCPVTILNTRDHLGKFAGKADERFFVGYFVVSKAMRVFNKRTRIVEETLNIKFLENAPNVIGNGPDWLFDVDSLSKSMNYVRVIAKNQTNSIAGKIDNIVADPKVSEEDAEEKTTKMDESGASDKDGDDDQATRSDTPVSTARPSCTDDDPPSPVNAAEASNAFEEHLFEIFSHFKNAFTLPPISNVTLMNDTGIFGNTYDDEDVGTEAGLNNLETTMNVSPIPITRIDKDHLKDQIIRDLNSTIQTRRMTKISDEHAMMRLSIRSRETEWKGLLLLLLAKKCQDTILGGAEAQSRFEAASKQSNDLPLSKVNTLGSREDSMKLMELMEHCTTLSELGRKQRKDSAPTEPTAEETPDEAHVSTPSYDPSQSELEEKSKEFEEKSKEFGKEKEVKNIRVQEIKEGWIVEGRSSLKPVWVSGGVLEEQEKDVAEKEVSAVDPVTTAEMKAAKPKVVTSATTTTTTTRPKARGVIVQELSEFKTTSSLQASQLLQAKDKCKGLMVEPEVPLKKKDQVALDEEMARNLEAQLQAELIKEERLARQRKEEQHSFT
ncbi:putative ribonuclease H-like domain-containing protein [Tanacetum coccineum]